MVLSYFSRAVRRVGVAITLTRLVENHGAEGLKDAQAPWVATTPWPPPYQGGGILLAVIFRVFRFDGRRNELGGFGNPQ